MTFYYRINMFVIDVPPSRPRGGCAGARPTHFLAVASRSGKYTATRQSRQRVLVPQPLRLISASMTAFVHFC
jgi:hypothetical protein